MSYPRYFCHVDKLPPSFLLIIKKRGGFVHYYYRDGFSFESLLSEKDFENGILPYIYKEIPNHEGCLLMF